MSTPDNPVNQTLEHVFREEYGRIIATLIRTSASFDLAEEALQEALTSAASTWEHDGAPRNPGAWLTTVAHRKLLDAVRRDKTRTDKQTEIEYEANRLQPFAEPAFEEESIEYPDDRLRLIFTCCHPSLSREAQVALTLRTLGGLTTTEIAHAFLLPEATLAQRLVRAKQKIRLAKIPYEIPSLEIIGQRLLAVQAVIYLIFNEGYAASAGQSLLRNDLCAEAIRLGRVLCELLPDEPENMGLLALMLLQDSRRAARVNDRGELVTLEEQDRSLWDRAEIEEGIRLVETALALGRAGNYQIQAAIAAVHAEATNADQTDWEQIVALYQELMRTTSSPVVALNHAAAVAMSEGPERGLSLIESAGASGALDNYYLYHASRADLLRRLDRNAEATEAYRRALSLTTNSVEQNYIRRRLTATVKIEDFIIRPRDSVRERELARRLRELPEDERFALISTLLDKDYEVGLVLARACLRDKRYFEAILNMGFKPAHAPYIDVWLKCVIPKLGFRKVVHLVTEKLGTDPKGVERAAYYLWVFRPGIDRAAHQLLLKLNDLLREKGLRIPF